MAEHPAPPTDQVPAAEAAAEQLLERLRVATRGEYDIFGELGRGGMATVYLAHEISLDRKVAIKVMSPGMLNGPGLVERFKREARTAAGLSHPNIIPIYAVREVDGLLFCVIKLVQGTPLETIMHELGKLPVPMVQAILAQVGDALGYAHRQGVVHRDIKPGNILIDDEGWAVVTDFGIAKVQETETLTMTGVAVGTPTYMSPEQCSGDVVTGASDQYSLGVVAYEMLAGRPPFTGTSMMALMYSHFHDAPPPLEQLRTDCPPPLRDAVMRMLSKNPADRWLSMEEATVAMGARPLSHDDPTRSQLISLARTGVSHRIISQVQTPRSPIPLTRKRGVSGEGPVVAPRRSPVLLGLGAVALLAAGYLIARVAAPGAPAGGEGEAQGVVAETPAGDAAASGSSGTPAAGGRSTAPPGAGAGPVTARQPAAEASSSGGSGRVAQQDQPAVSPHPAGPDTPGSAPPQPAGVAETPPVTAPPRAPGESAAARAESAVIVNRTPVRAPSPSVQPPATTSQPPSPAAEQPGAGARAEPARVDDASVEGARTEVRAAIQAFRSALAAGDLTAALRAFPGLPADQREGLQAMWRDGGTMTPQWTIAEIAVDGNVATARIEGTNVVVTRRGQAAQQVPVSLRARLERRGADWRIVSLSN